MKKKILDDTGLARVADYVNGKEKLIFKGTQAEWNALTEEEQAVYEARDIIDDAGGDIALYVNNQLELSDLETFTATSSAKLTCLYDGELVFKNSNSGWSDVIGTFYVNGVSFEIPSAGGSKGFIYTISVKKGDVVYGTRDITGGVARWYKKRDYSQRT